MPKPHSGEEHDDFMHRCVPMVLDDGSAKDQDQAVAMCLNIWRQEHKSMLTYKVHSDLSNGMEFVLSDETIDRMGDVIRADGWDLTNFHKNPIALFGHKSDFVIGSWKNLRVEGNALKGYLQLVAKGISARIDEVIGLVEAGVLRAVSVGFHEVESKPRGKGVEFVKQELVECSMVSIPANPNALAVAKSLGISNETKDLVFTRPKKERPVVGAYAAISGLATLDEWTPYEARKAKQWLRGFKAMYPMNSFYRKLYRLFDEIEAVRTVSDVLAETGDINMAHTKSGKNA